MSQLLSNTWFVTVIGGALSSLVAALIVMILSKFRPPILSLYKKSLTQTCIDLYIPSRDKRILQKALKSPNVERVINTRASNPGQEAQILCKAISLLTPSSSHLANPVYTSSIVERLLHNEFELEGSEKYQIFHDRNRERHLYFDPPPQPTDLSITAGSEQITLTWNTPSHPLNTLIWRYHIVRSVNPAGPFKSEVGIVPINAATSLSFTDKSLVNGTTYYYVVIAESRVLKQGIPSPPISSMPMAITPSATVPDTTETSVISKNSSTSFVPSTFFTPQEHIRDVADKCIGRKKELNKLKSDFSNSNQSLVLIEGFGGLGKTTLASRFAIDIWQNYHVLWIDSSGIVPTGERFLREIGLFAADICKYPYLTITVEDSKISLVEKEKALFEFLNWVSTSNQEPSPRPVALFFDDYHLVEDPMLKQIVVKIATSHIHVKVMLIIRYLPAELQNIVDIAGNIQLEGLSPKECGQIIEIYKSNYPALMDINEINLPKIWERTGQGIPTALRIFISMTRKFTIDDVLNELPALTANTRNIWFDKLFHELSLTEQQVATEFSIFRRPVSRRTLLYVSQCTQVKEAIEALVDRFVLTFDGRLYSMHALWSYYTTQHLPPDEAKVLHRKAANLYHSFELSDRHEEIMSRLESCYHYIQSEDMEQAEKELISIANTLRDWGFFQEFTDIFAEIEKNAKATNRPLAPQLLIEKSSVMYAHGEVGQAIATLTNLADKSSGEVKIKALLELGWIYTETAHRREAETLLEEGRELASQYKRPDLEEDALYKLQEVAYIEAQYKKALNYDQQRLSILEHMKNDPKVTENIALTHHNIGNIYRERGFYNEALEYYQRFLPFWRELKNPYNRIGWLTYNIGEVYRDQGKLQEAFEQFEDALQIFSKMQYVYGIAHVKIELGRVGVRIGPQNIAMQHVREAIDILRKIHGKSGEAYALAALGEMYFYQGQLDLALQYLQEGFLLETTLGNPKEMGRSLWLMGLIYEQQGKSSLLAGSYTAEACMYFRNAAEKITQAQQLFTQIDTTPNIYGIQDLITRVQHACNECQNSSLLQN